VELLQAVSHAVESAQRPGTLKKDHQLWRLLVEYTTEVGTEAVRKDDAAHAPRETFLAAAFIVWFTARLNSTIPGRSLQRGHVHGPLLRGQALPRAHGKRFDSLGR
jgi:hypothetical protein